MAVEILPVAPVPDEEPAAEPDEPTAALPTPSRRTLLTAGLSGLAGLVLGALGRPAEVDAAAGSALIMGRTTNSAGTSNTSLTTASTGTALKVTQKGTGSALAGAAVSGGAYGVVATNGGAAGPAGAIRASGANNHGVVASTANRAKAALIASNTAATTGTGAAVQATGGHNIGVYGNSIDDAAVRGILNGDLINNAAQGHLGILSPGGPIGAGGDCPDGVGVQGTSETGIGVYGQSNGEAGVYGWGGPYAVYGTSGDGYALYGDGDGAVTGLFTSGGGALKIDHPDDPAGTYLQHGLVQSPDMKTVYDGVVRLGADGEAVVKLPAYFEALNRDSRIQLTAVGEFSPLFVRKEVAGGRFTIAGGTAGQRVYWQVTGVRKDAWAKAHPVVPELAKKGKERGTYLHPEVYGQPASRSVTWSLRAKAPRRGALR